MSKLSLSAFVIITMMACNKTDFESNNGKRSGENAQGKASDKVLNLECSPGEAKAQLVTDLTGALKTSVKLSGEFCGVSSNATNGELTTLFVIDISGSMKFNDPLTNSSCGRLRAAEAIVEKLEAEVAKGAVINMSAVQFGSVSVPAVTPRSLADFKASLTPQTFCLDNGEATNYEAAFTEAKTMLAPVEGTKVVYFISDGAPTVASTLFVTDDQAIYDAGRRAAEALRAADPKMVLNAIYIEEKPVTDPLFDPSTTAIVPPLVAPATYLEQITGSKDRVRLVTNVNEIAAEIVTFDTPDVVTLDKDSVAGTIEADGLGRGKIEIASLEPHPTKDGVWIFETEAFELYGTTTDTTTNVVTLTIEGSDGKTYTAEAEINFGIE